MVDGIIDGLKENTNLDMNLNDAYNLLYSLDKDYMQKIEPNDKYIVTGKHSE